MAPAVAVKWIDESKDGYPHGNGSIKLAELFRDQCYTIWGTWEKQAITSWPSFPIIIFFFMTLRKSSKQRDYWN